jgi:hypothetical protein
MADIIIKGMEMPLLKTELIIFPSGHVQIYDSHESYLGAAQALPLPEKHGRLIDADAFEDAFIRYYLEQERSNNLVFAAVEIKQHLADMIGDWPTIVPAEGGTDDG